MHRQTGTLAPTMGLEHTLTSGLQNPNNILLFQATQLLILCYGSSKNLVWLRLTSTGMFSLQF